MNEVEDKVTKIELLQTFAVKPSGPRSSSSSSAIHYALQSVKSTSISYLNSIIAQKSC